MKHIQKAMFTLTLTLVLSATSIAASIALSRSNEKTQQQNIRKLLETKKQIRQAQQRYTENHLRVQELKRQLAYRQSLLKTKNENRMIRQQERSELLAEKEILEIRFDYLRTKYLDSHPAIKVIQRELEQINQRITHLRRKRTGFQLIRQN
jgi:hypothetical protein